MKLFKTPFHYLIALFCGLLIFFIAIIVVKQFYIDQFICKKEIQKIIQYEVKNHFLQVSDSSVIINGFVYKLTPNAAKKFEENLSILIEQNYKKNKDSLLIGKAKTSPIIIYPEKNNNSNYILSSRDLENIKEYIKYLTEKVDSAVKDTSDEVNKSIDNLNLWMTIWMGILAIIGIFCTIIFKL